MNGLEQLSPRAWRYEHVHEYLEICKKALAVTRAGGLVRLRWNEEALDLAGWQREFRKALDRRINLKADQAAGGRPAWRKLQPEYQRELRNDGRWINECARRGWRLRPPMNRFGTPEMQARYGRVLERGD
jgi:hypothetical protein